MTDELNDGLGEGWMPVELLPLIPEQQRVSVEKIMEPAVLPPENQRKYKPQRRTQRDRMREANEA
jgi:hypothetical protein